MGGYDKVVYSEVSKRFVNPHVLAWEEFMQHPVSEGCCIHHLDGNKLNNDILNLVCMEAGEHTRFHHCGRKASKETKKKKRKFIKNDEIEVYVQFCFFGRWIILAHYIENKETPQIYERDMGPAIYRYNSGTDETEIIKKE